MSNPLRGVSFVGTKRQSTMPDGFYSVRGSSNDTWEENPDEVDFNLGFGDESNGGSDSGEWSTGNAAILRGVWLAGMSDGVQYFRLRIVKGALGSGTSIVSGDVVRVFVLHGNSSYNNDRFELRDGIGGTALATLTRYNGGDGDSSMWVETNGTTEHPYSSDPDFSTMSYVDLTMTHDILEITNGGTSELFSGKIHAIAYQVVTTTPTISVTTQPVDTPSGVRGNEVVVTSSNTSDNTTVVTASITGSGASVGGTLTATMASGVARFPNLVPAGVGTGRAYHFAATGYTAIDSTTFAITAAETALHRSDFTASDGTANTALTPTIGTALRTVSPVSNEHVYTNRSAGTATGSAPTGNFTNQTLPADYTVRASVLRVASAGAVRGLWGRAVDNAHFYLLQLDGATLKLYKNVGGTYTELASATVAQTVGTPFVFAMRFDGSTIHGLYNGADAFTPVTDTMYASAGYAGFVAAATSGDASDATGFQLDYFEVTAPYTAGSDDDFFFLLGSE